MSRGEMQCFLYAVNLGACMGDTYIAVDLIDMETVHQLWSDRHGQKSSSAIVVLLLIAHL